MRGAIFSTASRARRTLSLLLLAVGASVQPALAAPPSTSYKLIFADEFLGSSLDTYKWNYNYTWGHQHNSQAYMDASQVKLSGGVMDLEAITKRNPNATDFNDGSFGWQTVNYTSGAVNTSGKLNFTRGYFEATVKCYGAVGSWPAFWTLQNGWPPEIDAMEFPRGSANSNTQWWENYHYTNGSSAASYGWHDSGTDLTNAYHTFGVEWTSTQMKFYLDGTVRQTINDSSAIADSAAMYLILDHGVGGWPGDVTGSFTSHFWVDSVKAWQIPSTGTDSSWKSTVASGSWDTSANWNSGTPIYEDSIARFLANDSPTVSVTWSNSDTVGGLHFDTASSYTIGTSAGSLQFAKAASGANGTIFMTQATSAPQYIASRVELYDGVTLTNNSAQPLTISGKIVGAGGLVKAGPGVLVLTSDNPDFTGGVSFSSGGSVGDMGVVRVASSGALGTGVVNLPASNGSSEIVELSGGVTIANNLTTAGRQPISGVGTSTFLRNYSGSNTWAGNITINATGSSNYSIESARDSLTLSGTLSTTLGAGTTARFFNFRGIANGEVTGTISDGTSTKIGVIKLDSGTWTLSHANPYTAGTTVSGGTLAVNANGALGSGAVTVNGGKLQLNSNLAAAVVMPALTVTSPGVVELNNNALVIDYPAGNGATTLGGIRSALQGGSIVTSLSVDPRFAVGYADAVTLGLSGTSFHGVTLDNDAVVLLAEVQGDTNLDGAVNFDDLLKLAQNYGVPGDKFWTDGDSNYDGTVNFDDLLLLSQHYGATITGTFAGDFALAQSMVPEPTTLLAATFGAALTLRRRRSGKKLAK